MLFHIESNDWCWIRGLNLLGYVKNIFMYQVSNDAGSTFSALHLKWWVQFRVPKRKRIWKRRGKKHFSYCYSWDFTSYISELWSVTAIHLWREKFIHPFLFFHILKNKKKHWGSCKIQKINKICIKISEEQCMQESPRYA